MLQSLEDIKSRFEQGDFPGEADFANLIDSFIHLSKLVHETGSNSNRIMSQKAITNALNEIASRINDLIGQFIPNEVGGITSEDDPNNIYVFDGLKAND